MPQADVLTCHELGLPHLQTLFGRYGLSVEQVADNAPIPGSWFGEPEAGLIGRTILVRADTPVHSAMHEGCHLICMDAERRANLHTNAGGDYDEENGVNYLQILLADSLPGMGRERMLVDMDSWGYSYRLGSARAWFEQDSEDALAWLIEHQLLTSDQQPTWLLRS